MPKRHNVARRPKRFTPKDCSATPLAHSTGDDGLHLMWVNVFRSWITQIACYVRCILSEGRGQFGKKELRLKNLANIDAHLDY